MKKRKLTKSFEANCTTWPNSLKYFFVVSFFEVNSIKFNDADVVNPYLEKRPEFLGAQGDIRGAFEATKKKKRKKPLTK